MAGKRVKLVDLMLRPTAVKRLTAEETVGFMARAMSPATATSDKPADAGRALS